MNPILENRPACHEPDIEELLLRAREQFAGDFVTGVRYVFARPDLTDRAEVQIYPGFGYVEEARANLGEQFQAGRVCMGAYLMFFYDVPWHPVVLPAYREALQNRRKLRSGGSNG